MNNLINNEWENSSDFKTINVINPATSDVVDTIFNSTLDDVNRTISISKTAFKNWKYVSFENRVNFFNRFINLVEKDKNNLAILLTRESGQIIHESVEQISNIKNIIYSIIDEARITYFDNYQKRDDMIKIKQTLPLGIVGVILSSSDVINSFCYKVFCALIMGNTVIVKPSELVPLTVTKLAYLLSQTGLPSGVIQIIHGEGKTTGKAMAINPNIKVLTLDGDIKTALLVRNATSRKLGRELFSLNGNDALILCGDGDVSKAVDFTVKSRLSQAGQSSHGPKRFIIHESLKDDYLTKLFACLRTIKIGDPLDHNNNLGSLINENRAKAVEMIVKRAINDGAELLYGGHRYSSFYEPTVLHNVNKNSSFMKTLELLGPVIPIITFSEIDEAISIANNIPYGINNYVFTKDVDNIFRLINHLESSKVIVNNEEDIMDSYFGGWKLSGDLSAGIEELLKSVSITKKVILKNELD